MSKPSNADISMHAHQQPLGARARGWITLAPGNTAFLSPTKFKQPVRGTALIRPSRHSRFSSVGAVYHQPVSKTASVGMSHDEANRAMQIKKIAFAIPKSRLLQDLWMVSGTALEDRELRKCDAIVAPQLLAHRDINSPSKGTKSLQNKSTNRYTYVPNAPGGSSQFLLSHAPPSAKGPLALKSGKHSRFSSQGALYVETKRDGADAFYSSSKSTFGTGRAPLRMVNGPSRFESAGSYLKTR